MHNLQTIILKQPERSSSFSLRFSNSTEGVFKFERWSLEEARRENVSWKHLNCFLPLVAPTGEVRCDIHSHTLELVGLDWEEKSGRAFLAKTGPPGIERDNEAFDNILVRVILIPTPKMLCLEEDCCSGM